MISHGDPLSIDYAHMAGLARETFKIVAVDAKVTDPCWGHAVIRDPGHRLQQPPSALELCRKVAVHRPVIIQGVPQKHFPRAWENWKSSDYLLKQMASPYSSEDSKEGPRKVKVALTPDQEATHKVAVPGGWGHKVFALQHEKAM